MYCDVDVVGCILSVYQWCTLCDVVYFPYYCFSGWCIFTACAGHLCWRCCAHDNDVTRPFTGPGALQLVSEPRFTHSGLGFWNMVLPRAAQVFHTIQLL